MPADLKNPFGESCCDGGICAIDSQSARSCGCDPGCKPKPYVCKKHEMEVRMAEKVYTNPLDEHLDKVVNVSWNFAGRCLSYEDHLQNAVLGLVGEAGEVADTVKKMLYHTRGSKDYNGMLLQELGDVAFYLSKTLELAGFTLEEVLAANKEKLASRHPEFGQVTERFPEGYIR